MMNEVKNMTFKYLNLTGLTVTEVLAEAKAFQLRALDRKIKFGLQEAIDAVIDAFAEAKQG